MLFFLILTLCCSVLSFDLKTISNTKELFDSFMKNNENGEKIVKRIENLENNLESINDLSEKNPLTEFGTGGIAEVPLRAKRDVAESSPTYKFCQRFDLNYFNCNPNTPNRNIDVPGINPDVLNCNAELPDSLDLLKHIAMPEKAGNSSDAYNVASNIASCVEIIFWLQYLTITELAEQQLTDCSEDWEQALSWTGSVIRLLIQGGFMLKSNYIPNSSHSKCGFKQDQISVKVKGCYQIDIQREEELKYAMGWFGPLLVGVRKANWDFNTDDIITDCDAVQDTYTTFLLCGYGTENGTDYWTLLRPGGGGTIRVLRGAACQDIGVYQIGLTV